MFLFALFLFALLTSGYGLVDIGKYNIKTCDRNSADVNDCLVDAIQEGLVVLADGIEELDLPAIDPYYQKEMRVEYKNNQIMGTMNAKDVFVEGFKTSTVRDARLHADDDQFNIEVDMFSPLIFVRGSYSGEGSYNSLRINATGQFNTSMTDLVYTLKLHGTPEKINDETYVKIDSFYMRPDVGNMVVHLSNDNPETRELTNLGTQFANANWKTLYKELLPYAQSNWNKIGIRVANKLFLKVPYDQLFPSKS